VAEIIYSMRMGYSSGCVCSGTVLVNTPPSSHDNTGLLTRSAGMLHR
jgi:hypothetical protein